MDAAPCRVNIRRCPVWSPEKAKIDGYFPAVLRSKAARIGEQIQSTFASAWKAGVKIGFGTDMGVGPHGDNAQEFLYMVEAGMPAAAALQSATILAAEVLGVEDQGVIEAGKRADIIALKDDPLANINAVKHVVFSDEGRRNLQGAMSRGTISAALKAQRVARGYGRCRTRARWRLQDSPAARSRYTPG